MGMYYCKCYKYASAVSTAVAAPSRDVGFCPIIQTVCHSRVRGSRKLHALDLAKEIHASSAFVMCSNFRRKPRSYDVNQDDGPSLNERSHREEATRPLRVGASEAHDWEVR